MVVMTHTQGAATRRYRRIVPRVEVTETAIPEIVAEANPQQNNLNSWVGFSLQINAAGTELTVAKQESPADAGDNYSVTRVYAR